MAICGRHPYGGLGAQIERVARVPDTETTQVTRPRTMLSPVLASCFLLLVPTSALSIAITGTNSGIGKSAASLLVAQGHTVCRDVETSAGTPASAAHGG